MSSEIGENGKLAIVNSPETEIENNLEIENTFEMRAAGAAGDSAVDYSSGMKKIRTKFKI